MDNDLISRSAFEQALLKRPRATTRRDDVIDLLAAAPTVDAIERLQAEYELLIKMYAKVCEEKCVLQAERKQDEDIAERKWISVKDRLPEESGSYLVFYREWSDGAFLPTYDYCTIRVMRFLDSRKWRFPVCIDNRCEADTHREITHWMPLPAPPTSE